MEESRRAEKSHRKHRSSKALDGEYKHHHRKEAQDGAQCQREKSKVYEKHLPNNRLPAGPALSGDDNYVQRWLATAEAEIKQGSVKHHQTSGPKERQSDHQVRVNDLLNRPTYDVDHELAWKRKRKRKSSSDSSMIESPLTPRAVVYEEFNPPTRPSTHMHTAQKIEPPEVEAPQSSEPPSSPVNEVFQKRPRHKTREDRYEPKTAKQAHRIDNEPERKRPKRATKSRQKKVPKKTGGELMQDFKSDKISNERLTMRPLNGPGLFKNGRASSPGRRRGVPDLAFSEMDFLQHASRYPIGPIDMSRQSKSREKERQKALNVQNSLTTFFQANRVPLREIEGNRVHSSSAHINGPSSHHKRRHEREEHFDRIYDIQQRPLKHSENSYPGYGLPGPSFEKPTPRLQAAIRSHPSSTSLPSDIATSYVSWSETQNSPRTTSTRKRLANVEEARRTHSPTPESIRRMIDETGIYRNTGIRPLPRHGNRDARNSLRKGQPQEHQRSSIPEGEPEISTSTNSNTNIGRRVEFEPGLDIRLVDQEREQDAPRSIPKYDGAVHHSVSALEHQPQEKEIPREVDSRRNVVVEHFDRRQGWHQQPSPVKRVSQTPISAPRSEPPKTTVAPLSREEIARYARIQRPLTSMSRVSNPSVLHPIPETEIENEQQQRSAECIQNNHSNNEATRSEAECHSNHKPFSERNAISAFLNRAGTSMGSLPTPEFSSISGLGVTRSRSAQTTPITQATSGVCRLPSAQESEGKIAALRNSHYLGLPVRGGAGVNLISPPSGTPHPIYTSQVMLPNMDVNDEECTEYAYPGTFGDHLECEEQELSPYIGSTQYEFDREYESIVEESGDQFAAHGDIYTAATQFDTENSRRSSVWQPNGENLYSDMASCSYNRINDNAEIIENYSRQGMEYGSGNGIYQDQSILEQEDNQMNGFWRPQRHY